MPKRLLIVAAAALSISAGQALAASPYTAIYSFGDSLSDVGNVFLATGGAEPASAPSGPLAGPYFNGEFSNGPVWVQDLASFMGLPALTPSLAGGNDYAFGFATTGSPYTNNSQVPNLDDQVGAFLSGRSDAAPSSALYTFSIGANDLFNILSGSTTGGLTPEQDAASAAQAVATAAQDLELAGAKDLMLFDVPNLGLVPAIQEESKLPGLSGLPDEASALAQLFNADVLSDIASDAPGLTLYDIDAYGLLTDAVNNPGEFHFSNVTDPCWTGTYTGYATGGTLCSTDPAVQDTYLFWDSVHPTEAGHLLIADAGANLIGVATPELSTWAMMALGFAGLGALGARKVRTAAAAC
jgi:phospholipase/lecithinase/hemolysin